MPTGKAVLDGAKDFAQVAMSSQEILTAKLPPVPEELYSAYKIKTKPEIVRFYHAAVGFPTKPTWLAAIKNNHYASRPGLTSTDVARYYPESEKT